MVRYTTATSTNTTPVPNHPMITHDAGVHLQNLKGGAKILGRRERHQECFHGVQWLKPKVARLCLEGGGVIPL